MYPIDANLWGLVAGGIVCLWHWGWTQRSASVAKACLSTFRFHSATLTRTLKSTFDCTTRALAWTGGEKTLHTCNQKWKKLGHDNVVCLILYSKKNIPAGFARFKFALFSHLLVGIIATLVLTVVAVAAVALLSLLHQSITTDRLTRLWAERHD